MNHSLLFADRNTHLKIVAVALVAAIVVVTAGIAAHVSRDSTTAHIEASAPIIVKAGKPAAYTRNDSATVR
jgi:hypothetical protein